MNEKSNSNIHFRDAYVKGMDIYFSAVEINGLFYINKNENILKFVSKFPEDEIQNNLHSKIIQYEDKLYFIPLEGKGISVFDLASEKIQTIVYKDDSKLGIINAFLINSSIILIPMNSTSPFLRYNIITEKYEQLEKLEQGIWKYIEKEKMWFDTFSTLMNQNKLYLVLPRTNILLICDTKNWKIKSVKFQTKIKLNSIAYLNGNVYLSCFGSSEIIKWNEATEKSTVFKIPEFQNKHIDEIVLTNFKEKLYAISSKEIIVLDIMTGKCLCNIIVPKEFCKKYTPYRLIAGIRKINDTIWIFSASGGGMLLVEDKNIKIIEIKNLDSLIPKVAVNKVIRARKKLKEKIEIDLVVNETCMEGFDIFTFLSYCLEKEFDK